MRTGGVFGGAAGNPFVMRDADDDEERARVCRAFAELLRGDAEALRVGSAGERGRLSLIAQRHGVDVDGGRLPLDVCSKYGCADAPRRRIAAPEHLAADVRTGGQRIMLACACAPRACHAEAWRAAVGERVAQLDGSGGAGQGGGAAAECGAATGGGGDCGGDEAGGRGDNGGGDGGDTSGGLVPSPGGGRRKGKKRGPKETHNVRKRAPKRSDNVPE
jgi:hypothetical protein